MTKRLWLAVAEHISAPGAKAILIHSVEEPTDSEIIARMCDDTAVQANMNVTVVIDIGYMLTKDVGSCLALAGFTLNQAARNDAPVQNVLKPTTAPSNATHHSPPDLSDQVTYYKLDGATWWEWYPQAESWRMLPHRPTHLYEMEKQP